MTIGFLAAGPLSGFLSDRFGPRLFATGGLLVMAASFVGLLLLPGDFHYTIFGILIFIAAFLGYNPIGELLGPQVLGALPPANAANLTGLQFFPRLISGPFHDGLVIVFWLAIAMSVIGALASLLRSKKPTAPDGSSAAQGNDLVHEPAAHPDRPAVAALAVAAVVAQRWRTR